MISVPTSGPVPYPQCSLPSNDYVQATRAHRRLVAAMAPLYAQYSMPLLLQDRAKHHVSTPIAAWHSGNDRTCLRPPTSPASRRLELCNGFGIHGLPLGMQILGRPFDEATVLRVGYAYQQATAWQHSIRTLTR